MKRSWTALALGLLLAVLVACTSSNPLSPSSGRVNLLLTDAPIDLTNVSAVEVTLESLTLFAADGDEDANGGVKMQMPGFSGGEGLTLNLLDFQNGRVALIGTADVPEGDYRKVRMRIASAELVLDDDHDPDTPDAREEIFVPSGKVDVPVTFSASAGKSVDVTLDFDAELSVQVNATPGRHPYILRPVITPVGVTVR